MTDKAPEIMTENERDFKGIWIPKTVWLDSRLNALDKIILAEIDSLDYGERGCWASNKYIADFCQCSERKVSETINKLIKYGYLYIQKFDGRTREIKSALTNFEKIGLVDYKENSQNVRGSIAEFARQPNINCEAGTQNLREINIINNIESNNINNIYSRVVTYLNEKAGTHYKPTTAKTKTVINARIAEGFKIDDFISVIDKKCYEWKNTEFERYLRPETLFGTKFEGYLNAKINPNKSSRKNTGIAPGEDDLSGIF